MAIVTKVRIGVDNTTLGTVRLTKDGIKTDGKTEELDQLVDQMRHSSPMYERQTDAEFLADLPNRLRSRTWAKDITNE